MVEQFLQDKPFLYIAFQMFLAVVVSLALAISLNFFLIPGDIFSSGITGIAQIVGFFSEKDPLWGKILSVGNLMFLLNFPLVVVSWFRIGKNFTLLTLLVVVLSSVFINWIPVIQVSENPLLNGIMGGVVAGFGSGVAIRYGLSCGGMDIISILFNRLTGMNVGAIGFAINSLIIMASGLIFDWEFALYTLISIYVLSRMIDTIHTSDQRLTAFVVTDLADEVVDAIFKAIVRGATILDGKGGYSKDKREVIMVVINRYEMHALQLAVRSVDEDAFINIIQSTRVMGHFFTRDEQKDMKKQVVEHTQDLAHEELISAGPVTIDDLEKLVAEKSEDLTNNLE